MKRSVEWMGEWMSGWAGPLSLVCGSHAGPRHAHLNPKKPFALWKLEEGSLRVAQREPPCRLQEAVLGAALHSGHMAAAAAFNRTPRGVPREGAAGCSGAVEGGGGRLPLGETRSRASETSRETAVAWRKSDLFLKDAL